MPSATKKCPECGTRVPVETEHCPNCPASFEMEDSGLPSRRKTKHAPEPVWWVVILALFGFAAWRMINFVLTYANDEVVNNPLTQAAVSMAGSTDTLKGAMPTPVKPLTTTPPDEAEEESKAVFINHGDLDSPEPPAPRAPRRRAGAKPGRKHARAPRPPERAQNPPPAARRPDAAAGDEWKLRGVVYDLVTLKPIPGAAVVLKDANSGRRIETATDKEGRYRLTVPSLPDRGYSVTFEHPDYSPSYLNPGVENVPQKPEDERRGLADELSRSLNAPYPLQGYGSDPLVTDYYLAPRRK